MSALAQPEYLDDYLAFCEGVRRLTGIDLFQYKRNQMERRMRSLANRYTSSDLLSYLSLLESDESRLNEFLDKMTINVSQLWRNPEQWRLMAQDVLPDLATQNRIRAWSAGCSYGAEAYTLASVCLEAAPKARVEIVGTDIDARMIERANAGRFSEEDGRDAPRDSLERWFEHEDGAWVAKGCVRKLVRFEAGDLLRMPVAANSYDLVLCRNTVIYFSEPVRDELHERLARSLRPGGYLIVGATERVTRPGDSGLDLIRPFTYRKR
jgi:chemotaxis protein methyltransferase CheR